MKNSKNVLAGWPQLDRAWQGGRLAQALLLIGEGRTLRELAEGLVRRLLCEGTGTVDCACRGCRTALNGHPDLIRLVPDGKTIKRGPVEAAVAATQIRPLWAPSKVIWIEEADRLTREAESYLLKHLEEPPAYVTYILGTADPARLLPTVRSRCQPVRATGQETDTVPWHPAELFDQSLDTAAVIQAIHAVRRRYLETEDAQWLDVWEVLWTVYEHLAANGNPDIAREVLRHALSLW